MFGAMCQTKLIKQIHIKERISPGQECQLTIGNISMPLEADLIDKEQILRILKKVEYDICENLDVSISAGANEISMIFYLKEDVDIELSLLNFEISSFGNRLVVTKDKITKKYKAIP